MTYSYPAEVLRAFARECLGQYGCSDADAGLVAHSLVQADLWGHPSHGIMRLFWYGARLASGATDPRARPEIVSDAGALVVIDGQNGAGQPAAAMAMETAIARAKAHGIGAVSVRNSGHFGTAMYFTRMAAEAGCVGYLCANASPAMAPWGGRDKLLGTNPFSWSAPAGRHAPMLLDIACTAVARGKLHAALKRGDPIPEGWAIDAEGHATTDPAAGIAGTILPMGGHKGFGVATMVDVMAGVLSGSAFGGDVTGPYVPEGISGAGHLAIAIDIAACRPLAAFEADMETLIGRLKSNPRAAGVDEIFYPGEREARAAAAAEITGIALPETLIAELRAGAAGIGVAFPEA